MKLMFVVLGISCSLIVFSVQAEQKESLKLVMTVMEEITVLNDQGKVSVQHVEATHVVPGDTMIYTTVYHNNRQKTLDHVVITSPIPKHLIYIQGSAEQNGVPVTYSINHGKTFDSADTLILIDEKGIARPATIEDYTHIRWLVASVLPKEKGTLSFGAKVK